MSASPYIGEITLFTGNFAPVGWAFCDGKSLSIADNTTLYTLIGTTYGGDGQQSFNLPDLRGRLPIHQGRSNLGTTYVLGESAGTETVTLTQQQMPAHTHTIQGSANVMTRGDSSGNFASPDGHLIGTAPLKKFFAGPNVTPVGQMAPLTTTSSISIVGGSQPHNNMQPSVTVNFIIALVGVFPSQG